MSVRLQTRLRTPHLQLRFRVRLLLINRHSDGNDNMMQQQVAVLQDDQPLNPYTEIQILQDHTDLIKFLLPLDESRFLSVSDDNTGIIWDVNTALKLCTLVGHARPITCACLMRAPGSEELGEVEMVHSLLLTGSSDRTIRVWSTETGACLQVITEHNATTKAIVSFPDHGLFCTGGQDLYLWDSDGRLLHCVKQDEEAVSHCPLADIKHMLAIEEENRVVVAAGSALEVYGIDADIGELGTMSFRLRRVKKLVPEHREAVMCLTRVSDMYFASSSLDGTVKVWNSHSLSTSRQLNHIKEYEKNGFPWCVQHMLPLDTKHLCITIGSGLGIFDLASGDCVWKQIHAHFSKITFLTVVCDGKFLASCSEDGTIRLWGVDPRLRGGEDGEHANMELTVSSFMGIVETRDRRHSKEVRRLFRREESRPSLLTLQGECAAHSGAVQMVLDFRHDGMVSCGADGLVILWKDGTVESAKRNNIIRDMLHSKSGLF